MTWRRRGRIAAGSPPLLAAAAALLAAPGSGVGAPMTPEDLVALKRPSDAQLAPDGSAVAFVLSEWDRPGDRHASGLRVALVGSGETRRVATGDGDARQPRWRPDGAELAFLSDRGGRTRLFVLRWPDGEPSEPFSHAASIADYAWSPDGREIAFLAEEPAESEAAPGAPVIVVDEQLAFQRLWIAEAATGRVRRLTREGHAVEVAWSPDGATLALVAQPRPGFPHHVERELYVLPSAGGDPRRLTANGAAEFGLAWSPSGETLAYLAATEGNRLSIGPPRIHLLPAGGGEPRVLAPDFDGYVRELLWAPGGRSLLFTAGLGVDAHVYRIPASGGAPEPVTSGEGVHGSLSQDRAGRTLAAIHESTTRPADVWVADGPGAPLRPLTDLNPGSREWSLGKVEVTRWPSEDGVEIEGLLVYPVDYREGRRYPTVLHVHGGPESAAMRGFMASWVSAAQVYAGAGYAMLMPNFRGSSNYGGRFALGAGGASVAAEEGAFADCMTGLDHLVERGIADPERLAIKGWSYGGYLTAWAIGHTDRFAAAVEGAGDTNLVSYYGTAIINPGFDIRLEHPYDDPIGWFRRSPLASASKVRTPTLILQGELDPIVPIGQSRELYRALRHFGVPTRLVVYPGQQHGLDRPSYQLDKMRRELEWIEQHLRRATRDGAR